VISNVMNSRRFVAALALSMLAGCATQKGAGNVSLQGPTVAQGGQAPQQPKISTRAKLLFEDALKLYEAQKKSGKWDYVALERKFQAALEEDSNLAEADYNLGVLAERQGNRKAAVEHYQGALKKKPTLRQAAENLAVMLQNDGNVQGAVQIYQQILTSYPEDASSRARLAEIYRQQGDHERAMQLAREALIRESKTLTAHKVMMRSYLDRQQLSMARLVALRAMKLDEGDPELYHTIGLILLKEGEAEKARAQFTRAVQARADFLPAHVILARMAMQSQDFAGAEEHLRRILAADSKNAEAHLNLGVAYKGMGDYDKALQEYEEAEKLNPELAAIYLNKGIVLHRHKDAPDRGLEMYRKYLALQAGGAALTADAPVFNLVKEAEAILQAREEERRAIEEAKRMEAELAAQQAAENKAEPEKKPEEKKVAPAPVAKPASTQAPTRDDDHSDEPDDAF
jgi:tetratricopeptide (TPR) repeat protein